VIRPRPIRELTIEGDRFIAAGSGLVRTGEFIYVISDDARELGVFPARGNAPGRLARFLPGDLPTDPEERKRRKPDVEALALLPGGLLALESGSKPQRRGGVWWELDDAGALVGEPRRLDLAPLYETLARDIPDLNIEGATVAAGRLLLFQRGNGRGAVNAVVALDLDAVLAAVGTGRLEADAVIGTRRHDLGELDGVRLCFSDATSLADGRVLFTAVAEGGEDTYLDGECAGAGVGVFDPQGELAGWELLEPVYKVEGIEAHARDGGVVILLVADADDPQSPSPLLEAPLTL
jgi:hypothetical protein